MRRIKQLLFCLLFVLFVPKVYAFSFDLEMRVDNLSASKGTEKEIEVLLKDVLDADSGLGNCSMNIQLFDNVWLNGDVQVLDGWSVTPTGNFYVFNTKESFVNGNKMFLIPIKIDGDGSVKLTNIECSLGKDRYKIDDKVVKFSIILDENNIGDGNNINISEGEVDIKLNDGNFVFDPSVNEYTVTVSDYDSLDVSVITDYDYTVNKDSINGKKAVVVSINLNEENSEIYIIYVNEENISDVVVDEPKKNNISTIIFIVVISLLVLINLFRIIKKIKK